MSWRCAAGAGAAGAWPGRGEGIRTLTSAPITPKLVRRRYSNGLFLLTVFKNGYRYSGMCALRKSVRVSVWEATHCSNASALHTRFDACAVSAGGESSG